MRPVIRDWFNSILIVVGFASVGVIALTVQVQHYRDQQASDAALARMAPASAAHR